MKNHRGFALLEGLLILVIVCLLGGVGWYVYNARNNTSDTFNNADAANSSMANYNKKTGKDTTFKVGDASKCLPPPIISTPPNSSTWQEVKSGKNAYTFRVPEGSSLMRFLDSDNIRGSIYYEKGKPVKIVNEKNEGGGDGGVQFFIMLNKGGIDDSFYGLNSSDLKTPFNTPTLTGYKYYYKDPLEPPGLGLYPGSENYIYQVTNNSVTVAVGYIVQHCNEYTVNESTKDEPNQVDIVDNIVKSIKLN